LPHRLIAPLICICLAQSAHAGPWLREKGSAFLAVSFTGTYFLETTSQTYFEYGLTDATTVIADLGMSRSPYTTATAGYATLSFRRGLLAPDRNAKLAYELGIGAGWIDDLILPHMRTGLSWGRGITVLKKSGWTTVESSINWELTNHLHVAKLDATLGLNFTDVTAGMVQIYSAHTADDSFFSIAPSIVISPPKGKYRIQIGTETMFGDAENSAIKLSLWREF